MSEDRAGKSVGEVPRRSELSVGFSPDYPLDSTDFMRGLAHSGAGPWISSATVAATPRERFRLYAMEAKCAKTSLDGVVQSAQFQPGESVCVRMIGVCVPPEVSVRADVLHPMADSWRTQTVVRGGSATPPATLTVRTFEDGVRINFCDDQTALKHPGLFVVCRGQGARWWDQTSLVVTPAGEGVELGLATLSGRACEALLIGVCRVNRA